MGMPVTIAVAYKSAPRRLFDDVFKLLVAVDEQYSPYREDSEVTRINHGLPEAQWSDDMQMIIAECKRTKSQTDGYFDAYFRSSFDPSGLVKGWAIRRVSELLGNRGYDDFYVDAGGDIQTRGLNADGQPWRVGVRNPFQRDEIVKIVRARNIGVATSGAYVRGDHVYNPLTPNEPPRGVASITVIGADIYDADRYATAAYAMGRHGIDFIERLDGFEAYQIDMHGIATMTSQFSGFVSS